MVETIFDSLNAKEALVAIKESQTEAPVIISAAVGRGGETMILSLIHISEPTRPY